MLDSVRCMAVDSGCRGRNNWHAQSWLYLFELRGGQSPARQGLPLAFRRRHLGLIHQGICIEVQQCANKRNEQKPLEKMLCMMHSLHEINKQTKWGYNKAIKAPIFKSRCLWSQKTKPLMRLDDKRWNWDNLCFWFTKTLALLVVRHRRGNGEDSKLRNFLELFLQPFVKKNHTHRKFYPPCDDSLPTKNVRDIDHSSRVSLNCLRSIHMIRSLQTLILLYSVRVAAKHERFHNFSRGDFKNFMGRWRANCSTEG